MVGLVQWQVTDSGDILNGSLSQHCAEGDYSGDMVLAIGVVNIFMCQQKVLKIHVDIRHRNTVRVEESLKQELVLYGIQIGDTQAISDG